MKRLVLTGYLKLMNIPPLPDRCHAYETFKNPISLRYYSEDTGSHFLRVKGGTDILALRSGSWALACR